MTTTEITWGIRYMKNGRTSLLTTKPVGFSWAMGLLSSAAGKGELVLSASNVVGEFSPLARVEDN